MVQLDVRHPQEGATRRRLGSGAESAGDGDAATVGRIEPAGRLRRSDRPRRRVRRPKRIAVIGSQVSAVDLSQELAINRVNAYTLVGWITSSLAPEPDFPLPQALGGMDELASLVEQHDIDLLLIGSDVPRLHVFDELVRLMDTVTVRVCELSAFYEDAFPITG